jgi:hypothetical protein
MFLMPYATVIVGAMPVIVTALVGTTLPLNTLGATPTKLTAPATPLTLPAKTIFKTPLSLYTVPTLWPIALVGSANKVILSTTIGVVESSWRK